MNATNREPAEILLIDEDNAALASASDALEAAGHIVYQAGDRVAALRTYLEKSPPADRHLVPNGQEYPVNKPPVAGNGGNPAQVAGGQ